MFPISLLLFCAREGCLIQISYMTTAIFENCSFPLSKYMNVPGPPFVCWEDVQKWKMCKIWAILFTHCGLFVLVLVLLRSLPWSRRDSTISSSATATRTKRRESSADFNFGINRGKLPTRPSVDKPLRRGSVTAIKRIVTSPGNNHILFFLSPPVPINLLLPTSDDHPEGWTLNSSSHLPP